MSKIVSVFIVLPFIIIMCISIGFIVQMITTSPSQAVLSHSKIFRKLYFIFRRIRTDVYGNLINNIYSDCIITDIIQYVDRPQAPNILDLYLYIKDKYSISDYHFWVIIKRLKEQDGFKLKIDLPTATFK